jgi:hypothetical protein
MVRSPPRREPRANQPSRPRGFQNRVGGQPRGGGRKERGAARSWMDLGSVGGRGRGGRAGGVGNIVRLIAYTMVGRAVGRKTVVSAAGTLRQTRSSAGPRGLGGSGTFTPTLKISLWTPLPRVRSSTSRRISLADGRRTLDEGAAQERPSLVIRMDAFRPKKAWTGPRSIHDEAPKSARSVAMRRRQWHSAWIGRTVSRAGEPGLTSRLRRAPWQFGVMPVSGSGRGNLPSSSRHLPRP